MEKMDRQVEAWYGWSDPVQSQTDNKQIRTAFDEAPKEKQKENKMKIDTEELHKRINRLCGKLKDDFATEDMKDLFHAGKVAGGLHALSDLKIELMEWEIQERTKGKQ